MEEQNEEIVKYPELTGSVFTEVFQEGDDEIHFQNKDKKFMFHHNQDCHEDVRIEDVVGGLDDLVGSPITIAEAVEVQEDTDYGSKTWTFFKFATIKGYVTIRWFGESSGYYSERVDFCEIKRVKNIEEEYHIR